MSNKEQYYIWTMPTSGVMISSQKPELSAVVDTPEEVEIWLNTEGCKVVKVVKGTEIEIEIETEERTVTEVVEKSRKLKS